MIKIFRIINAGSWGKIVKQDGRYENQALSGFDHPQCYRTNNLTGRGGWP
jgi:hypothetical protein